jgi:hypothetical protein
MDVPTLPWSFRQHAGVVRDYDAWVESLRGSGKSNEDIKTEWYALVRPRLAE